ncbi:hypothetical protein KIF53_15250 [Chromobacterium subtsugae]|uniref:CENP-V/GFA domain-containing protein n=1 Tax=Chromobacterium subtsugae TaxID=251747 RepID=A0ABS7FI59_9NEIS|nr:MULTISPECIES: hypothetical protein [Chromobacterium]MBW7567762.1 hypothetical protein [Chromobacterium subtsugae]MBW8288988.1 hypothetical protein [Chromobacterium subtsugae]WSE89540.1 hypothetical protein U6115_11645 [Chromobacterium subtsugae]WVH57911.1 hypothetical protein U6151_11665 [Chromobacterium subtsugae]
MTQTDPGILIEEYRGYKIICDCNNCNTVTGRFAVITISKINKNIDEIILSAKISIPNGAGLMNYIVEVQSISRKFIDRYIDGEIENK